MLYVTLCAGAACSLPAAAAARSAKCTAHVSDGDARFHVVGATHHRLRGPPWKAQRPPAYLLEGQRGALVLRPYTACAVKSGATAGDFFKDNVTGGDTRLKGHGRVVTRGTPGSRLSDHHYAIYTVSQKNKTPYSCR